MGGEQIDEEIEDDEDRASYLVMELQSTTSFRDIDIDKMLEHTSLDDFMRGLYSSQQEVSPTKAKSQLSTAQGLMQALRTGKGLEEIMPEDKVEAFQFGEHELQE